MVERVAAVRIRPPDSVRSRHIALRRETTGAFFDLPKASTTGERVTIDTAARHVIQRRADRGDLEGDLHVLLSNPSVSPEFPAKLIAELPSAKTPQEVGVVIGSMLLGEYLRTQDEALVTAERERLKDQVA